MAGKFTFGAGTFGKGSFGNSGAGAGESHAPHRRFEDLETKEEKDNYATWAHDYITEHPGDYDGAEQFASDKLFTWTSEKRSPYLQHAGEQGIGMSGPVNPVFGTRNFTEPDFDFDKLTDAQKDIYAMAAHDSQVKGGDDKANRLAGSMAVMDAMAADTAYNAALRQAYGQDFDQYGTLTEDQKKSLRTAWNEGGVRGLHTAVNGRPGEAPGLRYANTNPSAAPLKGDRGPGNGMMPYWNPTAETAEDDEISNRYEQVMSRIGGLDGIADPELRRQAKELEDAVWYEKEGKGTYRPTADDLHRYEETLTMLQGYAGFKEAAEEHQYSSQTLSEMTEEGLSSLLSAYNLGGAEGVRLWDAAGGAAEQLYDAGRLYRPEGEESSGEYSYLAPPDQSYIGELWDLAQKTWGMAMDHTDFDIMDKIVPEVLRSPAEVLLNRAGEKLDELAKAREKQKNQQGTEEKPAADTSSAAIWKTMQVIDRKMGEERDSMTREREDRYNRQKDLLQAYMTGQAGGEAVRQDVVNIMKEYADQEEQPSALSELGQAGQEMGMKALRMITGLMAGETNIDLDQVNSPTLDKWTKQLEGKVPTGEEILNFVIDQGTAMGAAEYAGIGGAVNSMVSGAYAVMRALGLDELAKGAIGALARSRGLDDKGAQALVDMAGQAYDAGRHKIADTLQQDVIDPLHKESEVSQERAKDQLAGQLEEWGVDKATAGTVADEVTSTLVGSSEMVGRMAPMMAAIWAKGLSAAGEATSVIGKIGDVMSGADFYINWLSSIGDSYQQAEATYGENTTYWDALGAVSSGYFDALIENYEMSWGLSNGVQKIIGMAGMPSFGDIVGSVVSEDMEELKQTFNGDFWEDLADWVNGRELRHPLDGKTQESMFNLAKYLDTAIESTKMTIGMDVIMGAGKFANGRSYTKAMNAVMDGTATPEDRQLAAEIATAVGLDKENQARAAQVETPGTEEQHNIFENAANQEDRGNDRTPGTDQRAQAAAEEEAAETDEDNSDVQNNEEADRLVEQAHVLANEGRYVEANEMLDRASKLRQKPRGNPKDMRAVREATERKAEADQAEQEFRAEQDKMLELERKNAQKEELDAQQAILDQAKAKRDQARDRYHQAAELANQESTLVPEEGYTAEEVQNIVNNGGTAEGQRKQEPNRPVKEATERTANEGAPQEEEAESGQQPFRKPERPVKDATERTADETEQTLVEAEQNVQNAELMLREAQAAQAQAVMAANEEGLEADERARREQAAQDAIKRTEALQAEYDRARAAADAAARGQNEQAENRRGQEAQAGDRTRQTLVEEDVNDEEVRKLQLRLNRYQEDLARANEEANRQNASAKERKEAWKRAGVLKRKVQKAQAELNKAVAEQETAQRKQEPNRPVKDATERTAEDTAGTMTPEEVQELVLNGEGPGPVQERPGYEGEEQEKPVRKPAPVPENEQTPVNPEPPTPVNPETPQTAQDDRKTGTPQEEEVQQELVNNGEGPGPDQVRPGNVGEEQEKPGRKPAPMPEQEKTEVSQGQGQEQAQTQQTAQDNRQTGTPEGEEDEEGLRKTEPVQQLTTEQKKRVDNANRHNDELGFGHYDGKTWTPGVQIRTAPETLTGDQRAELSVMNGYAGKAGYTMVVEDTILDKNGNEVNGYYNKHEDSGRVIHVAMNSENPLRSTMGHELYHMLTELNQAGAKTVAKAFERYARSAGIDVSTLVQEKIDLYYGQGVLKEEDLKKQWVYDYAYEECVADAMMDVIGDARTMQMLAMQDRSLVKRMQDWISRTMARIHEMLGDYAARTQEAKLLTKQENALRELMNVFNQALEETDALKESKKAGKSLGSNSKMMDGFVNGLDRAETYSEANAEATKLAASILRENGLETSDENMNALLGVAQMAASGMTIGEAAAGTALEGKLQNRPEINRAVMALGRYEISLMEQGRDADYNGLYGIWEDDFVEYDDTQIKYALKDMRKKSFKEQMRIAYELIDKIKKGQHISVSQRSNIYEVHKAGALNRYGINNGISVPLARLKKILDKHYTGETKMNMIQQSMLDPIAKIENGDAIILILEETDGKDHYIVSMSPNEYNQNVDDLEITSIYPRPNMATLYVHTDKETHEIKIVPGVKITKYKKNADELLRKGFAQLQAPQEKLDDVLQSISQWDEGVKWSLKKSSTDHAYQKAVDSGDMETAQRMVDQAAKEAGYIPVGRYHQTGERFTVFNTDNPVAGANDSETPNGIFFKENDHDIGVGADYVATGHGGDIQMKVYLKANHMLRFGNREQATAWYMEHVDGYKEVKSEWDKIMNEKYNPQFKAIEDEMFKADTTEERYQELDEIEEKLIKELSEEENKYRRRMRELLNKHFIENDSGYDGIELVYDGSRYIDGKRESVHTFIVFDPTQVKSADPVTYDDKGKMIPLSERFNEKNTDIRYSAKKGETETPDTAGMAADERMLLETEGDLAGRDSQVWDLLQTMRDIKRRQTMDEDGREVQEKGYWKKDAKRIAQALAEDTGYTGKTADLVKRVTDLFEDLDEFEGTNAAWLDHALQAAQALVTDIYTEQQTGYNQAMMDERGMSGRDALKEYFKGGYWYISPEMKKYIETYIGSYQEFRKTMNANGIRVTTVDRQKRTGSAYDLEYVWKAGDESGLFEKLGGEDTDSVGDILQKAYDAVTMTSEETDAALTMEEYDLAGKIGLALVADYMQAGDRVITTHSVEKIDDQRHRETVAALDQAKAKTEAQRDEIQRKSDTIEEMQGEIDKLFTALHKEIQKTHDLSMELKRLKENGADAAQLAQAKEALKAAEQEKQKAVAELEKARKKQQEQKDELKDLRAKLKKAEKSQERATNRLSDLQTRRSEQLKAQRERLQKKYRDQYKERIAAAKARQKKTARRRKSIARIRKIGSSLQGYMAHPSTANGFIPQQNMQRAAELIETLMANDGRKSAAKAGRRLMDSIRDAKESPNYFVSSMYDDELNKAMQTVADILADKDSLQNLSDSDLEMVEGTLKAIVHQIKNADKTIGRKQNQELANEAAEGVLVMQRNKRKMEGLGRLLRKGILTQLNAQRYFGVMSHHEDNAWSRMGEELSEGQRKKNRLTMDMTKKFEALTQGENEKKFDKFTGKNATWYDTGIPILRSTGDESGRTWRMNGAMRAFFALSWQAEENQEGMIAEVQDGVPIYQLTIPDEELMKKGKEKEAYARGERVYFTKKQAEAIVGELTEYEKAWMTAWREMEKLSKAAINETSLLLNGFRKANVGDYVPIFRDPRFIGKEFESVLSDSRLTSMGFLKERVNAHNPMMLMDLTNVINRQVRDVSDYYGFAIPTRNATKIYNANFGGTSFKEVLNKTQGLEYAQYFEKLMGDLQGGSRVESSIFDKVRGNVAGAVLAGNPSVIIKQAASYPAAAAVLGWKPLMKAMRYFNPVGLKGINVEEIDRYTSALWERRSRSLSDLEANANRNTPMSKTLHKLLNGIQGMDIATTKVIWRAAEYYVEENNKDLKRGTEEFNDAVARVYEQALEGTQPEYGTMQRPQVLRSTNQLVKSVTMYKTQSLQNFGILVDAATNYTDKKAALKKADTAENRQALQAAKGQLAAAVSSQVTSAVILAVMTALGKALLHKLGGYRDDKGDLTAESVGGQLLKDSASSVAGMVVGGSELFDLVTGLIDGQSPFDIEAAGVSTVNDLYQQTYALLDAARVLADGDATPEQKLNQLLPKFRKLGYSIAQMKGIPVQNVLNLLDGIAANTADFVTGKPGSFASASPLSIAGTPVIGSAQGRDTSNKSVAGYIAQAMMDGNEAEATRLYNEQLRQGKKADALNTAIAAWQKENIPEIREAAEAIDSGDLTEYNRLINEIVGKGVSMTNAVKYVEAVRKKSQEGSREQAEGSSNTGSALTYQEIVAGMTKETATSEANAYTNGMMNSLLEDGNVDAAKAVRDDMLANGKKAASINSSLTSYWKPLLQAAYEDGDMAEVRRITAMLVEMGMKRTTVSGWTQEKSGSSSSSSRKKSGFGSGSFGSGSFGSGKSSKKKSGFGSGSFGSGKFGS